MMSANFRFRVSRVDRLGENVIHVTGSLLSGEIQPECRGFVADTGLEVAIKSVVLVHPPDRPAKQVTIMIEHLPVNEAAIIGKDIVSKDG
jgi:hypothetical protein